MANGLPTPAADGVRVVAFPDLNPLDWLGAAAAGASAGRSRATIQMATT